MTSKPTSIIVIAHGSRKNTANDQVRNLVATLATRKPSFAWFTAFMELGSPSIAEVINEALAQGSTTITILPLFLVDGNHSENDIPRMVKASLVNHPQVKLNFLPVLCNQEGFVDFLTKIIGPD